MKSQQNYFSEKEWEAISAIRNTVIHDAENLGFVPIYEDKPGKESTMDQELDICKSVYEIATYNMWSMCVKSKRTMLTSLPTLIFDSSLQKRMKQVAYVNYTLNEFKELSQILGDFIFVDNCKLQ